MQLGKKTYLLCSPLKNGFASLASPVLSNYLTVFHRILSTKEKGHTFSKESMHTEKTQCVWHNE